MYRCCKAHKFLRVIVCDIAMIVFAVIITVSSRGKWSAQEISNDYVFLPVIMYHSICETGECDYIVSPETVESDFKYLRDNGYTSIFTEELINYVNGKGTLPKKPVIITADDGYYNNYEYLLPLLEKYEMKAVVSVVGYYSEYVAPNDPHNPDYSYLTWDDITEMSESGYVEIANHTYNMHSMDLRKGCSKLEWETYEEYVESFTSDVGLNQTLIKLNTGIYPAIFTYPYGMISKESIPLLKEMGVQATFSCRERPNYITQNPDCLFPLDRYNRPSGISTEAFMSKVLKE